MGRFNAPRIAEFSQDLPIPYNLSHRHFSHRCEQHGERGLSATTNYLSTRRHSYVPAQPPAHTRTRCPPPAPNPRHSSALVPSVSAATSRHAKASSPRTPVCARTHACLPASSPRLSMLRARHPSHPPPRPHPFPSLVPSTRGVGSCARQAYARSMPRNGVDPLSSRTPRLRLPSFPTLARIASAHTLQRRIREPGPSLQSIAIPSHASCLRFQSICATLVRTFPFIALLDPDLLFLAPSFPILLVPYAQPPSARDRHPRIECAGSFLRAPPRHRGGMMAPNVPPLRTSTFGVCVCRDCASRCRGHTLHPSLRLIPIPPPSILHVPP
ncbi:hypothetical protein C8R46DRAFT_1282796 [Mycena filopes]|nr:hypothetical protein C8R46DRAFT_1282796 [Mycena filopes]